MPTSWIEIADTAIKIGLGAFLSGASAYFISRTNHSKILEKEYILKHRAALEQVTLNVEEITHALLKYWSAILDWSRFNEKGIKNTKEKSSNITELRSKIFSLYKGLSESEGRLLLIGCIDQQKSIRSYGEKISEFYNYASRNNDEMSSEELKKWKDTLLSEREKLYTSLSKAYRKTKF